MKKYGFTIAELLLTIGIIGVLLVLLIRSTILVQPNQEQIMLKKAYHELSRIIYELINDDDVYPEIGDRAKLGQYLANTNAYTYKGESYQGESKFCELAGTKLYLQSSRICNSEHEKLNNNGHYTTHDGIVWSFPITTFTQHQLDQDGNETEEIIEATGTVYIDVDGEDKGDNCFENIANDASLVQCSENQTPDRFKFILHSDGRLEVPSADDITRYYISSHKTNLKVREVKCEI